MIKYRNNNEVLRSIHTLKKIWEHPNSDPDTIVAYQNEKLRSLIDYAYNNIRYYRILFESANIKPADIKCSDDLSLIPVTTSQDYRIRSVDEIVSRKVNQLKMVQRHTSGTTGRPFVIRRTKLEDHLINFFRIRAHRILGARFNDITASVGFVSSSHRKDNLVGRIRQVLGINRKFRIDCLDSASEIIRNINKIKPDILSGFPGALAYAAQNIGDGEITRYPRLVITGGESLTPDRRKSIEDGFKRKVYDIYGSHEFNLIAWQCKKTGDYHVCDDNVIFEVLKSGKPVKPGEKGEAVLTGLHSYGMPFIRYKLGDIVTRGARQCLCGMPFSTISSINGRLNDYFVMPDGQLIHPDKIIVPIMENESGWFDQYQLVQVKKNLVVLKIHPFFQPDTSQLNHVEKLARAVLPECVKFDIELVEELKLETTGKFRYCKSLVNSE